MDIRIAKQNATTIYENLGENELTYGKDGKLKTLGFLGKTWEAIVDYIWDGKASKTRIQKVNEFVVETLQTLHDGQVLKFQASSRWFNREGERSLGDLANRIHRKKDYLPGIDNVVLNNIGSKGDKQSPNDTRGIAV